MQFDHDVFLTIVSELASELAHFEVSLFTHAISLRAFTAYNTRWALLHIPSPKDTVRVLDCVPILDLIASIEHRKGPEHTRVQDIQQYAPLAQTQHQRQHGRSKH